MLGRLGVQQWPLLEALPHWANNTDNVRVLGGASIKPAAHPAAALAAQLATMGCAGWYENGSRLLSCRQGGLQLAAQYEIASHPSG